MANTLGFGPMGILPDTATPQSPADKRKLFDTLSIQSKVPANVLMALTEDGKTDPGLAASKISEAMASGKKVEDIVGPEVMSRAYDIADQVYADRKPAPPPKPEGGFLNAAGVGIDQMQQGIGSAVEGLGRSIGLQSVEAYGADVAARNKAEAAAGSQGMTSLDDVNGIGSAAQFASETVGQNAPQLGLSLAGAGGGTLAGAAIGSVVPVVGTTVGGIVGGVLGGLGVSIPLFYGQNRERQKEAIGTDQTRSVDESTAFLASLPQAALDTLSSKLLLGAGKLVTPLARAGGGLLTRAVRGTAKGVITEVPTEIGQQVIERAQAGLDITSDEAMNEYIAAGVAAGILGGGVGGASEVYHGQNGGPQPSPKPLALPAPNNGGTIIPEAPPRDPNTPDDGSGGGQGVMSGGAISTPPSPSVTPATPPMGPISRAAVLAPDLTPQPEAPAPTPLFPDQKPGNAVQLLDPETGVTHDATFLGETPEGVSVRVNGEAIMLTAQEFDQASRAANADRAGGARSKAGVDAPKSGLPDYVQENDRATTDAIRKRNPAVLGRITALHAQEKTAQEIATEVGLDVDTVRSLRRGIGLPEQEVGSASITGITVPGDKEGRKAFEDWRDAYNKSLATPVPTPSNPAPDKPLTAQVAQSAAKATKRPKEPAAPLTPPEALKRAQMIEDTAKRGGWNARLKKQHAEFMAVANQGVENGALPDVGGNIAANSGTNERGNAAAGQAASKDVPTGPADTSVAPQQPAPSAAKDVAAPTGIAKPDGPLNGPKIVSEAERGNPVQPDMLGGTDTPEAEMMKKERRRREWGQYLAIAEGTKSPWDGELEGRTVTARPGKVTIRARTDGPSDLDYRIDTSGMSSDEIARATRGALSELDRRAPLQKAEKPDQPVTAKPTDQITIKETTQKNQKPAEKPAETALTNQEKSAFKPVIENIREKAAILRGTPKDQPPTVAGFSLKWDEKEGGFIFSRKHVDAVRKAVGLDDAPVATPTAAEVKAAASLADPNPTDAQKEAGNYAMGHIAWNGLDLTIETAKGATRSGKDTDGEEWSVKMPADYGYIKQTTGADGDHLDFYMGPQPDAAEVYVIDQVDASTKAFDEHKVMIGFRNRKAALDTYALGFSDGMGRDRLGAHKIMSVPEFLDWVKNGDHKKPVRLEAKAPDTKLTIPDAVPTSADTAKPDELDSGDEADLMKSIGFNYLGGTKTWGRTWEPEKGDGLIANMIRSAAGWRVSVTDRRAMNGVGAIPSRVLAERTTLPDAISQLGAYLAGKNLVLSGPRLTTKEQGRAAGAAWANQGKAERWQDDLAMGNASQEAKGGWTAGYRAEVVPATASTTSAAPEAAKPAPEPQKSRPAIGSPEYTLTDARNDLIDMQTQEAASATASDARLLSRIERQKQLVKEMEGEGAKPEAAKPAATGLLSSLSKEKQDRAAELKAKLAAKARTQLSSGLDPEYITLGGELVALYIEAGTKRFAQMLRDFAESTGLTLRQAQEPMRAAYNHVRDNMDLAGEDVSDMDDAKAVLAEVRNALAEADAAVKGNSPNTSQSAPKSDTVAVNRTDGADDGSADSTDTGKMGQGREPQADSSGRGDGNAAGPTASRSMAGPEAGAGASNEGMGRAKPTRSRSGGSDSAGDNPASEGRLPSGGSTTASMDGLGDARPDGKRPEGAGRSNYRITDPEALFAGGPKARFSKNRKAMEAYQRVTDESRQPTPEELDELAAFTGWGSFGQELFQGSWDHNRAKPEWKAEDAWLREHLGKDAWESAQNSIINAHYTDPPTVKAIWDAVKAMGFKGGRVLEPAMGVGNFFGMMPSDIEANSSLTGIELEQTTGAIAKMLYPRANVRIMGYEKSQVADGFYDLVIGNWPFANVTMADRRYDKLSPSLHDYFFVKGLDQVRAGGLVVGITSAFSMDGQKNLGVRRHLARNAELVASFRLPSGAFEKYAGTKVVTDLIILRKRPEPAFDVSDETWIKSVPFVTPSGDTINVNQYYIDNPQQILGTIDSGHGTTYGKAGMIVHRPADIAERLAGIASRVPADGFRPVVRGKETRFVANTTTDRRFSITIGKDGALYHVLGDQMSPLEDAAKIKTTSAVETEKRLASIKALVGLRNAAEATLNADQAGSADADALRADLKKRYQSFVKDHGKIADSFALRTMEKLRDPNSGLVAALETRTGDPSPLMSEPTVRKNRKLDNPTIRDAFVMARNEAVQLDLARVSEISSKPVDDVTKELLDAKAIYRAPGGAFEPSDAYLSGNVRQKLREAEDALAQGEDMQASVDALKAVIPADVPYFQIEARFGADWLPVEHNRQFILDTLGITNATDSDMRLTRAVTGWRLEVSDKLARMPGIPDITGAPLPGQRGTGLSLRRFLEATLNTQTITVTYEDDEGTHKDTKATEQANQKAADLRQKFGEWVWGDPERRMEVERDYNEAMNAVATPVVDGSFLEFPGMALKRGDQPFNLRQHQSNAIWKGILNQRGIYGHEVGTGKTITMTGIAVESRRYGLARKPLLIAHNANSAAVAAEAQETYPGAKILYVNNLAPDEINAQLARMATEDWDLIVIPHSLLDRMALTYDTLMSMAADDIAAYEREAIQAAEDDPSGGGLTIEDMDDPDKLKKMRLGVTAKEMVKARNRMIQNIEKQSQRASKDGAVSFEKLGIDMILVDESHEFKKPPLATRMQVKGLNTGTSNKSLALRFLTSYVKAQRGGTGVHVFTGTPITNTLSEIYHQMFYAMDDVMRQNSVDTWDGFFKTFADTIADVELTSTGDFENVERLAAFINVSELRRMAGQYMDIVFAKDMPEFKPRATESGKIITDQNLSAKERDYLENGRMDRPEGRPYKQVINDIGPMGTDQKRILDEVIYYANVFKSAGGKQRREIMLGGGPDAPIVYNNVPNRASMDARLQEIDAEDHPKSKANRAVNNLARIYLEEPMATQVLFMDEGYSDETTSTKTSEDGTKTVKKKKKFNLAKDIVEKLVAKGVKREEIAIVAGGVTAEQKKAIADAMNQLKVRVVIGQTKTLGVGVNMQKYLRAMHHLDAPWMPGDLEQRNGRGERQGNTWNTVFEYRYLTEGLDGRRWQVLSIKDRFIKAFLQAKDGVRVIEGDAADDAETVDGSALADTLSQAAGDPRLMLISKLKKNIDRLQNRERIHTTGIADALKKLRQIKEQIERIKEELPPLRDDAEHVVALRAAGTFTATMNGKTFTERAEATEAINAYLVMEGTQLARGKDKVLPLEIQGFAVKISKASYAYQSDHFSIELMRRATRNPGQKTLASIEATIRGIPTVVEKQDERINDLNGQVSRLDKAKDEPFQQAGDLAKKKVQKAAIEQDLQDNPVPPPSWLRIGAPIDTLAFIDGKEHVVTGHRWTSEAWLVSTDAGDFDYKGVTDQNGMPLYEPREFVAPVINEGSKMKGVEDEESESRFDLPPVATLTGKELGDWEDMRQLGKKAEAWYRANLLGKRVTNAQSGMEISFTSAAAKKLSGRKGDVLYRSVPALREILEKGTLTKTSPETKGRSHIKAWHAISATVMMDGMPRDLVAHVMETKDGNLHYDLSRDMSDGARFLREGADTSITAGRYGLEDNPVELNLDFAEQEIKPEVVPVTGLKALASAVEAEVVKHGLAGKVTPRVVRGLLGASGVPIQGRQIGNIIEVNPAAADGMVGVMRHEIVHALRDPALWDTPFGLFSRAEWLGLVNEAKADAALVAKIAEKYGDKSQAVRTEEAVAETYRLWAQGRDMAGPVAKAFAKVKAYLQAVANALRGQGFQSAALTMERIASGSIGGRGPDGGGRAKKTRLDSAESRPDAAPVKVRRDNPGGEWLASKIEDAERQMLRAPPKSAAYRGITGATTGYHTGYVSLPTSFVASLPGASGETRKLGEFQYDNLMGAVEKEGWRGDSFPISIVVNHKGEPFIVEGNTRAAIAKVKGIDRIAAQVQWLNGGEDAQGSLTPEKFKAMADPISLPEMESRFDLSSVKAKAMGVIGSRHWRNPGEFVSNLVTDAMAGRGDYSALALVPGRPLFAELGKHLMAAKAYLRGKEEMDALRNQWHAKSDEVAQKWMALRDKMPDANNDMMDLMHRTTLAGIDPSKPDTWKHEREDEAKAEIGRHGPDAAEWAFKVMEQIKAHTDSYAKLRAEFVALPSEFQALYPEVRAQYDKLGDDFEKAILENIQNATRIGLKRAERAHRKEMERIRDEGLEGAEKDTAIEAADAKLTAAKKRGGFGAKARIQTLRKLFESNKLKGPYFPLARFGTYFVTIRDENGAVTSFSRFAKESQQQAFMREMKDAGEARIEFGTIDQSAKLRSQVNPAFVADMEALMSEAGAPNEVLDMIWQRYLETLPDQSIRTSKIHRKGRAGYNNDALRAFGSHMFHGAHQLARLKYGLVLEEHLNDAEEEARRADNPNRALLVVAEMKKRHDFAMNPTGSSVVASMSSLAFVWYLAATPAAALANISQTTVVGAPILSARFQKAGLTGVLAALGKATKDFAAGKGVKITDTWTVENSPNLNAEERAAMVEAYRRGIVDRTQAHDLASVAETGIEYNPWREKWMKRISFFFHHAERFNREVTFLAAYRLAITEGQKSEDAMNIAADMTYKTHFDMQNTSRPRVMQNDLGKILTTFRNFTVNMLWRLFRDSHQAMNGASKEERREARAQLVGITLSLMAHAGIRGTWGYGLIMLLLGILTPGADDDDIEEWLQDALLMEGDNPGVAMWNYTMGAALNGVPGQVMGVSLTDRIGMPNLWFRGQDRDLEGADLYSAYVGDLLGPTYSVGQGFFRGAQLAADGQWWRGTEAAVPKVIRDAMKSVRYVSEGALTMNGDSLVENVNPYQALMQGIGFTPAKIAERYDINNRLKNHEKRIIDERSALQKAAVKEAMSGSGISESMLGKIQDFNSRFPEYPITSDTLRQSAQSTALAHQRNEFGVSLNPKLNERLRSERATAIYN